MGFTKRSTGTPPPPLIVIDVGAFKRRELLKVRIAQRTKKELLAKGKSEGRPSIQRVFEAFFCWVKRKSLVIVGGDSRIFF